VFLSKLFLFFCWELDEVLANPTHEKDLFAYYDGMNATRQ
jgi:hypothetical protein